MARAPDPRASAEHLTENSSHAARRWGYVTWDHQELRDDRVQWFADKMAAGSYAMTYQARATIDGVFSAMPATVEAMYQPDVRARTARELIKVTK